MPGTEEMSLAGSQDVKSDVTMTETTKILNRVLDIQSLTRLQLNHAIARTGTKHIPLHQRVPKLPE